MENSDVVEVNKVLEHLSCPICFEIPEAEVYQCLDGHEICKKCHSQLTECPQCRVPFDPLRPIRNRHFERLLESFKVNCSISGCSKRLSRNLIAEHEKSCCFNFEKYGNFVPLCSLIGYTACTSLVNNGNSEEIAKHLISIHGCMQSKGNEFSMELIDFQKEDLLGMQFWTPIISNLKDEQCYLVTLAVLDTIRESFGLTSIFLPYSNSPVGSQEIKFEFSIANGEGDGDILKHIQAPLPLKNVEEWLLSTTVPFPFQFSWVKSHSRDHSKIFINCKINEIVKNVGGCESVEQFVCAKHNSLAALKQESALRWNNLRRSPEAHELFYRKWAKLFDKNGNFTEIIQQLFSSGENEQNLPGVIKEDVKWLSLGALFLTAQIGTFNDLRLLIDKEINACVINEKGATPLHLTMLDKERTRGLKKAKLLVEKAGAKPSWICFKNQNLLHFAVNFAGPEAVKYFLEKGVDVNQKDRSGCTPLHLVVENSKKESQAEIAQLLLQGGADGAILNLKGESCLRLAMNSGRVKLQKLICTKMLKPEYRRESLIPVGYRDEFLPFVKTYLEGPPNLSRIELINLTLQVILHGGVDSLAYLHTMKVGFNKPDAAGVPVYFRVMLDKNLKIALDKIKFLVENHAADLNLIDNDGRSFLHFAASYGDADIVQYLLEKGMEVNGLDKKGNGPLYIAMQNASEERALGIIKVLLESGAKTKIKDTQGLTPLGFAVSLKKTKDFLDSVVKLFQKCRK